MTSKKKPPADALFDPTIPEDGVVVPVSDETLDFTGTNLPSYNDIAIATREAFGSSLPEELLQDLIRSSVEVNESVRRLLNEHMNLGFRFGEMIRIVHRAYMTAYGDSANTFQRAKRDAFAYIEKLHRISNSKIRQHIASYAKFHNNSDAVEFLRKTDMQMLLANDIGDDVVNAVIEARKDNPGMSTREVKDLIAAYRHNQEELTATQEQVETVNNELAKLTALYDLSRAEEQRLNRDMEQLRLERAERQAATDRLRNELTLIANTKNTLHQELTDVQNELAALRRERTEKASQPASDNPEAQADLDRINAEFQKLMRESSVLSEKIQAQKAEEADLEAKLQRSSSALEMRTRLDNEMGALVAHFGEFVQKYHSAQLLCIASATPGHYKPVFDALADVVGKFHAEIEAARKAT